GHSFRTAVSHAHREVGERALELVEIGIARVRLPARRVARAAMRGESSGEGAVAAVDGWWSGWRRSRAARARRVSAGARADAGCAALSGAGVATRRAGGRSRAGAAAFQLTDRARAHQRGE